YTYRHGPVLCASQPGDPPLSCLHPDPLLYNRAWLMLHVEEEAYAQTEAQAKKDATAFEVAWRGQSCAVSTLAEMCDAAALRRPQLASEMAGLAYRLNRT
ncbi:hypothetical protein HaLaN_23308, partial [Haematococcus lacustris]